MWHWNGLPNSRRNPGRRVKDHQRSEGSTAENGGRRRVVAAEWMGHKAFRRRVGFSLTVQFREVGKRGCAGEYTGIYIKPTA